MTKTANRPAWSMLDGHMGHMGHVYLDAYMQSEKGRVPTMYTAKPVIFWHCPMSMLESLCLWALRTLMHMQSEWEDGKTGYFSAWSVLKGLSLWALYTSVYSAKPVIFLWSIFQSFVYLDAHAEWEGECGDDEKDGDEGEQQGAAPRALRVSCKTRKQMFRNNSQNQPQMAL